MTEPKGYSTMHSEVRLQDSLLRLYVVSQVHGALDHLQEVDEMIACDAARLQACDAAVLHAGGYIDKGNHVPELLSHLERRTHVGIVPVTYLLGAHEWLMSRAIAGDRRAALEWLLSGAEASLDRWGVPTRDWVEMLPTVVPHGHIAFLGALAACAVAGRTRFMCSTFADGPARPFGLFGQPVVGEGLFGEGPVTPIGNFSDLMRGAAPDPWTVRDLWTAKRISCAVLDRRVR